MGNGPLPAKILKKIVDAFVGVCTVVSMVSLLMRSPADKLGSNGKRSAFAGRRDGERSERLTILFG